MTGSLRQEVISTDAKAMCDDAWLHSFINRLQPPRMPSPCGGRSRDWSWGVPTGYSDTQQQATRSTLKVTCKTKQNHPFHTPSHYSLAFDRHPKETCDGCRGGHCEGSQIKIAQRRMGFEAITTHRLCPLLTVY